MMPTATEWTAAAVVAKAEQDAELAERCAKIRREIRELVYRSEQSFKRHEAEMREIQREIRAVYDRCPHPSTTHTADPSGNSDSDEACDVCGADMYAVAKAENARRWKMSQKP